MWHPEPFVKHAIPETRPPTADEAARSLWFSPLHVGRSSAFEYWPALVVGGNGRAVAPNQAGYLNPPAPPAPEG